MRAPYIKVQEFIFVTGIIGILLAISITAYTPLVNRARVMIMTGYFNLIKQDILLFRALNGQWPADIKQVAEIGFMDGYDIIIRSETTVIKDESRLYQTPSRQLHGNEDFIPKEGLHTGSYVGIQSDYDIEIEEGAVHFTFKEDVPPLAHRTLTMRPVVSGKDPWGPVHWACGNKNGQPGWIISGDDRTDINETDIPKDLR